jgi:2-methylcitrate dehydratase PrpD
MDSAFEFAKNIFWTSFDALPERTVHLTKRIILDSFGVALAGARSKECSILAELARHWNGKPESTLIGFDLKAPSPVAALVNGTMVQAMDFDETHDVSGGHTASCVIPAALALGEIRKVNGRELITAVALGIDLACRLGLACRKKIGWTSTSVYGCFGAAAAGAKILRLPEEKVRHALGIAISQAAGTTQTALDSPLSKHMQSGFASQAGVLSAVLADRGVTGVQQVFEGEFGFFNLYKSGDYDKDLLLSGLGRQFEVDNLSIKPFPCCRATHGPIQAVAELVNEHGIGAQDISSIKVVVPGVAFDLVGHPFVPGDNPIIAAQFSISYTIAAMLIHGRVSLEEFTPRTINDSRIQGLIGRIKVERGASLDSKGFVPVEVEIESTAGGRYFKRVEILKGHPDHPMGDGELLEKFRDCAGPVIGTASKEMDRLIDLLMRLEALDEIGELVQFFRFAPGER